MPGCLAASLSFEAPSLTLTRSKPAAIRPVDGGSVVAEEHEIGAGLSSRSAHGAVVSAPREERIAPTGINGHAGRSLRLPRPPCAPASHVRGISRPGRATIP